MKANELMIGDWVKLSHLNKIGKVYRIDVANGNGNGYAAVIDGDYHEMDLEPILLTPEILEKNGFEKKGYSTILTADGFKELPIYKYKNIKQANSIYHNIIKICASSDESKYDVEFGIGSHIFNIKYVHELQHALRLCGIEKTIEL